MHDRQAPQAALELPMDRRASCSALPSAAFVLLALAGTTVGVSCLSAAREDMGEDLASAPREDGAALSAAFSAASAGQRAAFVEQYFVDSLFIVCFALLVFSLLRLGPLPPRVQVALYGSSVWLHPAFDWAENWVALRSFLQFMREGRVELSAAASYAPLSYIKWAMLAVNVVALVASLVLYCRDRASQFSQSKGDAGRAEGNGGASDVATADLQP